MLTTKGIKEFIIFDLGVVRWELSVLVYDIKGSISFVGRCVCMDLVQMGDDVEVIHSKD